MKSDSDQEKHNNYAQIMQVFNRTDDGLQDAIFSLREEIPQWTGRMLCCVEFTGGKRFKLFLVLADWGKIWPMDYVSPLLDIIKSPETSGKLTAAALHGVQRILEHNVLGKFFSLEHFEF